MTLSGPAGTPLLLLALTLAAWGVVELVRVAFEWRRTGFSGDVLSSLVVMLAVIVVVWLDGVFTRLGWLPLPANRAVHLSAGLVLLWAGLALRFWAAANLRRFYTTTVLIQPAHHLVTTGPYAVIRHPSYAGLCLALLGLALASGTWGALAVTAAALAVAFGYRIRVEESALRKAFGSDYDRYAARTRRLVPGLF